MQRCPCLFHVVVVGGNVAAVAGGIGLLSAARVNENAIGNRLLGPHLHKRSADGNS